jgi:hypothetical protein
MAGVPYRPVSMGNMVKVVFPQRRELCSLKINVLLAAGKKWLFFADKG